MDLRERARSYRRITSRLHADSPVFAVVSWGCAATMWIAKALSLHPDIFCVHGLRNQLSNAMGIREWSASEYIESLRNQSRAYALTGDIHSLVPGEIPPLAAELGDLFRSCVVVRHPIPRIDSFVSLARRMRFEKMFWDLDYLQDLPNYDTFARYLRSDDARFFVHAVITCNAIVEEQYSGPIFRSEDLVTGSTALKELIEHVSAGRLTMDGELEARIARIGRLNEHATATTIQRDTEADGVSPAELPRAGAAARHETGSAKPAVAWEPWQIEVFERLLKPEARALYEKLGYDLTHAPTARSLVSRSAQILALEWRPRVTALACVPAEHAVAGTVVDVVVAAESPSSPVASIQFAVNDATDGSIDGAWSIVGTRPAAGSVVGAHFRWDTNGLAPGEHRIGANVVLDNGATLWWFEQPPRRFQILEEDSTNALPPRPTAATVVFLPARGVLDGTVVNVAVSIQSPVSPITSIQLVVNHATDGSIDGEWSLVEDRPISGTAASIILRWDTSGLEPGEHRVGVNVLLEDGNTLWWFDQPPVHYEVLSADPEGARPPRPEVTALVCVPAAQATMGTEVDIAVSAVSPGSPISAIQVAVNDATDGSTDGGWSILQTVPAAGPAASIILRWDTSGLEPGEHRIGVNVLLEDGNTLWWFDQPDRHYRLLEAPPAAGPSLGAPASRRTRPDVRADPPDAAPVGRAVSLTVTTPVDTPELEYIQVAYGAKASSANDKWKLLPPESTDLAGRSARFRWDTMGLAAGEYEFVVNLGLKGGVVHWWYEHNFVYPYRLT